MVQPRHVTGGMSRCLPGLDNMREFLLGAIRDPNTKCLSLTRSSGVMLVISGIVFAFMHPDQSASIGTFFGGGAFTFFSRTRTTP